MNTTKKRGSITELIGALERERAKAGGESKNVEEPIGGTGINPDDASGERGAFDEAALRLGLAMLKRLNVSENSDITQLVDGILEYWENEPTAQTIRENAMKNYFSRGAARQNEISLPRPIRAGISEAPEADYENMSSEQFQKLKKQLQRAAMNGRRIKI